MSVYVQLLQLTLKSVIRKGFRSSGDRKIYVVSPCIIDITANFNNLTLAALQCDERCAQYTPCMSSCPAETCDNLLRHNDQISTLCKEDSCIEGCQPKPCPPGHVYLNSSLSDCVPRNICKIFCKRIDNVDYYEGDVISKDDCHTCHCLNGGTSCAGVACTTLAVSNLYLFESLNMNLNYFSWKHKLHQLFRQVSKLNASRVGPNG